MDNLDIDVLKGYLATWKQGGKQVTSISARGIEHIADEMGISVTEQSMKECSDGKGYYFTAKAENMVGRTFVASVWQPKTCQRNGREAFDPDAVAKGSTRVNRNAIRGLLPIDLLTARIQQAVKQGQPKGQQPYQSPIQIAQEKCRQAIRDNREKLSELGIDGNEAYRIAQERQGDVRDWGANEWEAFAEQLETQGAWFDTSKDEPPF